MSQLLWGTLTLGLLVLAGVGLYSWWDMRRARKKLIGTLPKSQAPRGSNTTFMVNHVSPGDETVVMADSRIEPRLHDDDVPHDAVDIPAYERLRGQSAADVLTRPDTAGAANGAVVADKAVAAESPDALSDIVSTAFIEYESPIAGQALLQHLPGSRRAGAKPVEVLASVNADDTWESVSAQRSYRTVRMDVLLANRQGPLNEMDYSEFVAMVQRLAEATEGDAEFDDMHETVKRARELDEFAATHDALISLTLRARNAAWSIGYLQQSASANGFVPGQVPGRMVKLHPAGDGLIALQFDPQVAMSASDDAQPKALNVAVLVLDVPQAQQVHAPLVVLKDSAAALAKALDAAITDEQGRALSDDTWLALSSQLSQLYEALDKRGLAAGGAAARRVYS